MLSVKCARPACCITHVCSFADTCTPREISEVFRGMRADRQASSGSSDICSQYSSSSRHFCMQQAEDGQHIAAQHSLHLRVPQQRPIICSSERHNPMASCGTAAAVRDTTIWHLVLQLQLLVLCTTCAPCSCALQLNAPDQMIHVAWPCPHSSPTSFKGMFNPSLIPA